jgi:hypothetical protein
MKEETEPTFPSYMMRRWFFLFTDEDNPTTFMKPGASAREAGYQCKDGKTFSQIGYKNRKRLEPLINAWLEDQGMSDSVLKGKLARLMNAKETKIISVKGTPTEMAEGVRQLSSSSQTKMVAGPDGPTSYMEEHTVIAIDVDNLEVQRKAVETALKMKGLLREELNVTGLEGLADRIIEARNRLADRDDGDSAG